jgi:hypothetical protein
LCNLFSEQIRTLHASLPPLQRAIQNDDPDPAEQCSVDHVKAAAVAALSVIEPSSASNEKRSRINNRSLPLRMAVTRVPASS